MSDSPTPRTEAALCRLTRTGGAVMDLVGYGEIVPADFARTLERELAVGQAHITRLCEAGNGIAEYRAHLSGCAYDMTETCTCGRREAAEKWRTARNETLKSP